MNWLSSFIWSDEPSASLPTLPFSYDPVIRHVVRYRNTHPDSNYDFLVLITDLDKQFLTYLLEQAKTYPIMLRDPQFAGTVTGKITMLEFWSRLTWLEHTVSDAASLDLHHLYDFYPAECSCDFDWWFQPSTTQLEQQKHLDTVLEQVKTHGHTRDYFQKA